ncbi:hypothetical protein LSH36_1976g00007 [Paralvinella palmiformis]|uniref:Malonyl-CoA:ACP transacylase (MAT) domain-containing protein n=1 Tax=Paralvinella palmiformis TaxID=53620 RepID=A0AAD9ISE3_9ANNE|nr:hypothetical protein LSH36_1976g00007 [Paralvinella palmiformis]
MYSLQLCLRSLQLLPKWKHCTKRTDNVLSAFISKGVQNGFTLYYTSRHMCNHHSQSDDDTSHTVLSPDKLLDEATLPKSDPVEFPSDLAEGQAANIAQKRSQKKHAFRPKIDPKDATILLFPGQGSQFVGMGQQLLEVPGIEELYSKASDILGYDLLELCLNGSLEKLNQTVHCQPAVFVTSIAAVDKLKYTCSWAIEHCITAAGFSIGEYAALVFSALNVIQVRAKAMHEASLETPSGMMTALEFLEKHSKEFAIPGMRRLPVSGVFHTDLMKPGPQHLKEAIKYIDIETAIIPVH